MLSDRITEEADWKDGMDAFRQYARREIEILKEEIKRLKKERSNDAIQDRNTVRDTGSTRVLHRS